jgi:3-isopropylmalate/(R)-2-methylmalate dehydratase small subunit
MNPVSTIVGTGVPLNRANVDTDQIIPKQFLKRVERSGFGEFLFYDWARDAEGELDPGFVLNDPSRRDAVVLVTGPNFGSGSSREHAPWSLEDWGFRAIVAPSFADIFYTNCTKIGLLPIVLADAEVERLMQIVNDPEAVVTIDLDDQTVSADGFDAGFSIDPFIKQCLLNGLDHIALTMQHGDDIDVFEERREAYRPVTTAT